MEHVHEPDLSTLRIEIDGGAAYLDIDCACGESGCIGEVNHDTEDGIIRIVANDGQIFKIPAIQLFDGNQGFGKGSCALVERIVP
jgi:hypothetical protein